MKIQLASDLHLEWLSRKFPGERVVRLVDDCDLLVLAGDIHNGTAGVEAFSDIEVPTIYVMGNHEFYDHDWRPTRTAIKEAVRGTKIQVLDNESVEIDGVRFVGCTLWTDFLLSDHDQSIAMLEAGATIADFRAIRNGSNSFSTIDALTDHMESRAWLQQQLALPYAGKTVVVTHHAPHPLSIAARFQGNPMNAAFISDLEPLVRQADFWLHGHVHDSFDYRVGKCRVVANPRGYPRRGTMSGAFADARFENEAFQSACVIEL